ncbi:hypothetical protein [Bacillus sp. FJAT-52991]|uniref:Uncharacterized protein n=1 Tax=Bacillus kandeliae TaxID=3129297 RepID=A0ABZ2N258_9BACI
MSSNTIFFIVLILIIFMLRKHIKFRTVIKWGYTYKHFGKTLNVTYKRFTGLDNYNFIFRKGNIVTISYDVKVEEGELTLEWTDRKKIIWQETFKEDSQGTFTTLADHRLHCIQLEGKNTKGGCHIEFTEKGNE